MPRARRRVHTRPALSPTSILHRSLRVVAGIGVGIPLVAVLSTGPALAASSASLSLSPAQSSTVASGVSMLNGTASLAITVPDISSGGVYVALQLRSVSDSINYRTRVRVLPDGTMKVGFSRGEQLLVSESIGQKVSKGQTLRVEGSVSGTSPVTLQVRAWADGTTKPGWQQTYADSSGSRVTSSAAVKAWTYLSGSATKSATVAIRDLTAVPTTTSAGDTSSGKPSAATTGVPAGTSLTRHDGNITVTKDGTVLDRMDIHGFVTIKAANVKITNSIVRGGRATGNTGLVTNYGYSNFVIEDSELKAEYPSVWLDGLKGWNFTARRIHVTGNVDSVKIHGDNASVQNSLLENTTWYASDPNQGGGATHNDNVQILRGANITLTGNTMRGASNFAVVAAASQADANVRITNNWLDGGHCTVKMQSMNGRSLTASMTGNKFGPNRAVQSCVAVAEPTVALSASNNVFENGGGLISILRVF